MVTDQRKLAKERESLVQAIKDVIPDAAIKDDLIRVIEQQEELEPQINTHKHHKDKSLIHPSIARLYHQQIKSFRNLYGEATNKEVREHIRALIEKIVLTPKLGQDELSRD